MNYQNRMVEKSKALVTRKLSISVEWRIAANDQEWAQLRHPSTPALQTQRDLRRWMGEVLLLIFVLGGIGGWQWYATQAEWQQVASELTAAVQQEVAGMDLGGSAPVTAQRFKPVAPALPVAVKPATPSVQVMPTIHLLDLQDNQAIVTVIAPTIAQAPAYRQTQFYRHTTAGCCTLGSTATTGNGFLCLALSGERCISRCYRCPAARGALYHHAPQFWLDQRTSAQQASAEVSVNQPAGYVSPWFGSAF